MFQDLLEETRRNLGAPPRNFAAEVVREIRTPPPQFMHADANDQLWKQYRQRQGIFTHGTVVWGQVVQANPSIYHEGSNDAPANYIYSLDPEFEDDVVSLAEIADSLLHIRTNLADNTAARRFANLISDDYEHHMLLQVPYCMTNNRDIYYTTGIIPRSYLPLPRLVTPLLPILVVPGKTEATWAVPSRWWAEELVDLWFDAVSGET
jgi:hypothetical protein